MSTPYVEMDQTVGQLRSALGDVYAVESSTVARTKPEAVIFRGKLLTDSDSAFDKIRPRFESLGFTPQLERMDGRDVVTAMPGIVRAQPSNPLINLLLFIATVVTTFIAGATNAGDFNPVNGTLFSASLLLILGAHELGHYFVARHYNAPVTLPYFIPLPPLGGFTIGTLGAVIRLKAPFVNRKRLFDVGIAGPLAGLVFAIPVLLIGLSMTPISNACLPGQCLQEGNSILYALAKLLVKGRFLPSGGFDVDLTNAPLTWAGWVGLFVTALNLLPAGQLDGGHIVFALFGRRARIAGWITVVALFVFALPAVINIPLNLSFLIPGLFYPGYLGWLIWVGLIYLTGVNHPVPLNDISDLGMGRRILGLVAILIFILLFTPLPFSIS